MKQEEKQVFLRAFYIVWLLVSTIVIFVLIASFFKDLGFNNPIVSSCPLKEKQNRCFLCGMSRAFVSISHGQFSQALKYNSNAILLYGIFLIHSLLFILHLIQIRFKK